MNSIHQPVYLSFERKVMCCECLLYYKCKSCIKICKRQIPDTSKFIYFKYNCKDCLKTIKILLCSNCNNIKCQGNCKKI